MQNIDKLRQAGLRVTMPRTFILSCLEQRHRPISVETIWNKVKKHGINRVTVYRTLETLAKADVVRQIDLGHTHTHYEMNDPAKHHHHFVCDSCGDIQDVQLAEEKQVIQKLEKKHRFRTRSHAFEMFGLCAECQLED